MSTCSVTLQPNAERPKLLLTVWARAAAYSATAFTLLLVPAAAAPPGRPGPGAPERTANGQVSEEIRTKRLVLVDRADKPRAVLNAASPGPVSLAFIDRDEKVRVVLIVEEDGVPRLELRDAAEKRRVVLSVLGDRAGVALYGEQSRGGLILDIQDDGTASVLFIDSEHKLRAGLTSDRRGAVTLKLHDPTGKARAAMGVGRDSAPHLTLLDERGTPVWRAP
jgi:hypothetical protein